MRELLCLCFMAAAQGGAAAPWATYDEFERDATNALTQIDVLISSDFTNRLTRCRKELDDTNELASAAWLMLAISGEARSNHVEASIGATNYLNEAAWFLTSPATARTLWQKSCALALLSTGNSDPAAARVYFHSATNALRQWEETAVCFDGGELYKCIARHYDASELNARLCLIFTAADAAKTAGLENEFSVYRAKLPAETRSFLDR